MKKLILIFIFLLFSYNFIEASNLIKIKPSLQGSKQSLQKQNMVATNEGLTRITDSTQLEFFVKMKLLVPLKEDSLVIIDSLLYKKNRYTRKNTANFIENFSIDYYKHFKVPIKITSAVRTIAYQKELCKINSNAASATGPMSSTHTTGATIDISHKDMSENQKKWVRDYLLYYEFLDCIEATEEKSQLVFHVMVFSNYDEIQKMSPYVK